ncbi:MAG: hypothetical protein HYW50_01380 [Candidatus Diapherotrites archaeon]|nr:hypothetical protein [Candidatus Diapherotrites archaeon]
MVNKIYLKAVAFGLVFSLAAFFVINQLDALTIGALENKIIDAGLEADESKLFFQILSETEDKATACSLIKQKINQQFGKNAALVGEIDAANKSVFLTDILLLKKRYSLANAELYYLFKQANGFCGDDNQLVLFFYRDQKPLCADCLVFGKMLDQLREKCPNVKVFSFPVDLGFGIVELFKSIYGFETAPAAVVNEKTVFEGLVSEEKILQNVECGSG